jgi:hypothetical protein
MGSSETYAGTPILDLSAEEFAQRYLAGELDDVDPDVPLLVGLLGIGQNGHNVAA